MTNEQVKVTTLAGGCFWCLEAVFEQVRGVESVTSGYAGGHVSNPTYEQVCMGITGHAEVTQVVFHPDQVSYRELLEIFFSIHDPTTLNRQGPDIGTQYRSAIFFHDDEQKETAKALIAELTKAEIWGRSIVTEVEPLTVFYPCGGLPPGVLPQELPSTVLPGHHQPQSRQVSQAAHGQAKARSGAATRLASGGAPGHRKQAPSVTVSPWYRGVPAAFSWLGRRIRRPLRMNRSERRSSAAFQARACDWLRGPLP